MQSFNIRKAVAVKVLVSAVLLSLLAAVAGSQIAPNLHWYWLLLYSAGGAALLLVALVAATIATRTVSQFILRKGGTDTQWFWFQAEPRGLVRHHINFET